LPVRDGGLGVTPVSSHPLLAFLVSAESTVPPDRYSCRLNSVPTTYFCSLPMRLHWVSAFDDFDAVLDVLPSCNLCPVIMSDLAHEKSGFFGCLIST